MQNGDKKKSQAAMARRFGVTKEYLNSVLRGRNRPGGKLALRLAVETGIPLSLWLTGPENRAALRSAWQDYWATQPQQEETT